MGTHCGCWPGRVCHCQQYPLMGIAHWQRGVANPLATILSLAMLLRYSLKRGDLADKVEAAVQQVLASGLRTGDIAAAGEAKVGTVAMGDAVVAALG